jgi:dienelactone hydrolase
MRTLMPQPPASAIPTQVVHGAQDTLIPRHQIDRLMKALNGPKELHMLPDADHQFGRPEDFRVMTTLLAHWMIDHLTDRSSRIRETVMVMMMATQIRLFRYRWWADAESL